MAYPPRSPIVTKHFARKGKSVRMKRAFLLLIGLAGVAGILWLAFWARQHRRAKIGVRPREQTVVHTPMGAPVEYIPPFRATTVHGKEFAIAQLEDKTPIVIEFVADWCRRCVADLMDLQQVADEYGEGQIAIVAIHRTDTEEKQKAIVLASRTGPEIVVLVDADGRLFRLLNGGAPHMPLSLFIDQSGRVVARVRGPKTEETIRVNMARIVSQKSKVKSQNYGVPSQRDEIPSF